MSKKAYMKEAAEELGLTEYQLRRRAKEHSIPFLMSGKRYIFDVELCKEFLKNEALKNAKIIEPIKQYGVIRRIECE
ncbi:MerR family transcriptional regulator [Clostridium felsineum]|uniref:Uncharacterized protein n=1 Tax=Clostridium felsineum TaxID=36839 RepID=A0A1S8L3J1_9CLOT|nr:hypothetical protein [Clostridium felsineum]URZ08942.1 hypothetical protein CLROS_043460 [Clostridium felsineum]URZ09570.1 hypothetical protein CROST_002510 [Clostridium felsineum]